MKNIKKLIIILIIICIIVLISILIIINKLKNEVENDYANEVPMEIDQQYEEELNQKLSIVQSENDFFTLESQIQKFFLYYKVENKEALYEIIQNQYIENNGITIENSIETLSNIYQNKENNFVLEIAYMRESMSKIIYYTKGIIDNDNTSTNCYMTVYWDQDNSSFSIKPINENEYNQYISEDTKEENEFTIIQKTYNKLQRNTFTEEEKAEKYFKSYIKNALYDIDKSYQTLEPEYKAIKFPNVELYKEYLLRKKDELQTMDTDNIKSIEDFSSESDYMEYINGLKFNGLKQYSFTSTMNNKSCICIDYYGYYYIFNIIGAMQYTVILDTYTIDLPEFIQKYDAGNDETKIGLNISKVIEAINNKDYEYIYNKLNETFRNNNFNNISVLEEFIKNNFYNISEIKDFSYNQEGNVYICTINLKNKENESDNSKNVTILMRLLEDRNFEISFSL